MATTIIGLFKGKKKAEPSPATTTSPAKGPVITQGDNLTTDIRRRLAGGRALPRAARGSAVPLVNTSTKLGS